MSAKRYVHAPSNIIRPTQKIAQTDAQTSTENPIVAKSLNGSFRTEAPAIRLAINSRKPFLSLSGKNFSKASVSFSTRLGRKALININRKIQAPSTDKALTPANAQSGSVGSAGDTKAKSKRTVARSKNRSITIEANKVANLNLESCANKYGRMNSPALSGKTKEAMFPIITESKSNLVDGIVLPGGNRNLHLYALHQ